MILNQISLMLNAIESIFGEYLLTTCPDIEAVKYIGFVHEHGKSSSTFVPRKQEIEIM